MTRRGRFTVVVLACVLALAGMAVLSGQRALAETYNWKLQSVWRTPATQDGLKAFAENVKKLSGGKINIKVYAANELVKIKATREAVQSGAIEMGAEAGAYTGRSFPRPTWNSACPSVTGPGKRPGRPGPSMVSANWSARHTRKRDCTSSPSSRRRLSAHDHQAGPQGR